jgi:hypothetical protein
MGSSARWLPGDVVVLRGVGYGKLWFAMPSRVVQDRPERIALFWREGTRWKDVPSHPPGRGVLTLKRTKLIDLTWTETDVLLLARPGEAHTIWAMWEAGRRTLRCWYVNLQTPLRRTSIGFDAMDHELDIVIQSDLSAWRWKDEDKFERMVTEGVFSIRQARAIRREGEQVIREMQAGKPPFCEGWERWSPPLTWPIPELPSGWDILG